MPVALAVDTRTQHAFVRNGDGTVSVLDLTRGTPLRTVVVSKPDADAKGLAVDEQTGRVFVTSSLRQRRRSAPCSGLWEAC
jgi:DNA-binding beta-propeller fold protein YncE